MAHEHDRIDFKPGGRVTVGFTPRARDRWPVDGRPPAALPAGRATGREMAASPQGSLWASRTGSTGAAGDATDGADGSGTSSPVDGPGGRPAVDASGVAYTAPPATADVDLAAASGLRRQVFGFLPYWELSGASTKINNAVLSTIAYFSVGADRAGNLRKKDPDGTNTTGWGGWTSSNLTSVISSAHQHGTRVVLTVSVFAWTTAQANVQRALLGSGVRAAHPRQADRGRHPRSRRRRRQPRLRAPGERVCGRVRRAAQDGPDAAEQGPQGLPAHLRHDRVHRQLPARGLGGLGRGRRDLRHGLRLPHRPGPAWPGRSTRCRAPPTTSPIRCARTRPASARAGSSSASRGTAGRGRPPTPPRVRRRSAAPSTATAPR